MEFSADRHNTLFHIDDSLDHISELLLRHFVQLVPGHGIPNYFVFHHPRPTNSSLPVSPHWGVISTQARLRIAPSPVNNKFPSRLCAMRSWCDQVVSIVRASN